MKRFTLPVMFLLVLFHMPLPGEEWAIIGARALGMGGAGVAAARGAAAAYWNPALYATEKHYDMDTPIGIGIGLEGDMLEKIDFIGDRLETVDLDYFQNTVNDEAAVTADPTIVNNDMFWDVYEVFLIDVPQLSNQGTGVAVNAGAGIEVRLGNYGFSAMGLAYAGAHPTIDLTISGGLALADNVIDTILDVSDVDYNNYTSTGTGALDAYHENLVTQIITNSGGTASVEAASTLVWLAMNTPANPDGDTVDLTDPQTLDIFLQIADATFGNDLGEGNELIADNISGIDIGMIVTKEAAFTFSTKIYENRFAVGTNIKAVIGETYLTSIIVSDFEDGEDILRQVQDLTSSGDQTLRLGVDIGCIYAITEKLWTGLTVRNINQPTFPYEGDKDGYTIYSQTRGGIAWQATETLLLAADIDLFPNISEVVFGYTTQYLAAGLEWQPVSWWALRTGLNKNLSTSDSPTYSLGMGFRISKFYLDFAGSMGFSDIKIESDVTGVEMYVPERFNFMLTMGFSFDF